MMNSATAMQKTVDECDFDYQSENLTEIAEEVVLNKEEEEQQALFQPSPEMLEAVAKEVRAERGTGLIQPEEMSHRIEERLRRSKDFREATLARLKGR